MRTIGKLYVLKGETRQHMLLKIAETKAEMRKAESFMLDIIWSTDERPIKKLKAECCNIMRHYPRLKGVEIKTFVALENAEKEIKVCIELVTTEKENNK